jgi:hypothetical protein
MSKDGQGQPMSAGKWRRFGCTHGDLATCKTPALVGCEVIVTLRIFAGFMK